MSKHALWLIAKAKRRKARRLDLGNCDLRQLPSELFQLTWLEELNLCNEYWDHERLLLIESKNNGERNKLFSLPKSIEKLQSLKISNQTKIK